MKEIKEDLLKRLCEDEISDTNTVRKSSGNIKPFLKSSIGHSSFKKNPNSSFESKSSTTKPPSFFSKHNLKTFEDANTNDDQPVTRIGNNYDTHHRNQKVSSPNPQPRATPPLPSIQQSMPKVNDEDDLHSECIPLEQYYQLKDKFKKWLNENKILVERIHYLEQSLRLYKKKVLRLHR
jgi:hypothetical protein